MKNEKEVRVCWCMLDNTDTCKTCTRKVLYPSTAEKILFFDADEED